MDARADEFDRAVFGSPEQPGASAADPHVPTAPPAHEATPTSSRHQRRDDEPPGSALDERWQRWMGDPRIRRAWEWGAPALVVAVAAATRFAGLDHPHAIVFDETYYVKDAYTLSHLGYEARWQEAADESFLSGNPDTYTREGSFIVHPPIGKWIIAGGMAAFGTDSAFGWRAGMALAGVLLVIATMLVARGLFRSTTLMVVAGGLLAIDGNAIVMSRVALLDTAIALFALLGAGAVLLDRHRSSRRLDAWVAARRDKGLDLGWGPVFWWRPWLLTASVAFGLAAGVKWNGFYFLAVFGIYTVVSDALLRRRAGIEFWGTGTVLRQAPVNFVLLVPLALVVYVASWTSWFATEGGYYRRWIEEQGGEAWTGALEWVPYAVQNWWHYQAAIMNYHVGESSPHSYQAHPLTWLFLVRPTSMHYQDNGDGTAQAILDIANPILWWAATAALGFLVVRVIRGLRPQPRYGRKRRVVPLWPDAFILTGMAAGYLPWLLYPNRTVFQFYSIAFEPYMVLALTAGIAAVLGSRGDPWSRRTAGITTVAVFLGIVVLVSAFFLPLWVGASVPYGFMTMHYWFRTWI